jgi:cytochrome c-type biogenesis protein CcmH/NrfF
MCLLVSTPFLAHGTPLQERQERIERLEAAILAPCCYTQTVALHQSEVAVKIRLEIARSVDQGKADDEILAAYVSQYGKKVLVDPKTLPRSWMLVIPWAVVGLGTLSAACIVWHWQTRPVAAIGPAAAGGMVLPDVSDIDEE